MPILFVAHWPTIVKMTFPFHFHSETNDTIYSYYNSMHFLSSYNIVDHRALMVL